VLDRLASIFVGTRANLQLVVGREMCFRAEVGKEMGEITEGGLEYADAADKGNAFGLRLAGSRSGEQIHQCWTKRR
jgi:hypothetical protein